MAKKPKGKNHSKEVERGSIRFPLNLLKPIGEFLKKEARKLENKKKELISRDPFQDSSRVLDNAASDTDAAEQIGHQKVNALQNQIEKRLIQIRKALTRIKIGKYGICERCGKMIDTDRLMIMPETTLCMKCAQEKEK